MYKALSTWVWETPLDYKKPLKTLLIRMIRIFLAAIAGFRRDNCFLQASALTFYSLLSIVPVLAVAFGIAKGFGFAVHLEAEILHKFQDNPDFAAKVIEFTYSALEHAQGGLIGGLGIVFLFWSCLKLLNNIETSLNTIWKVQEARSLSRKFSDYLATMIFCPIFFAASSSISVFVMTRIIQVSKATGTFEAIWPLIDLAFHIFPFILCWLLFGVIYGLMPNTGVSKRSAFLAGVIAGSVYQIVQMIYINFQVGVSSYGAVYGSFAALPLFLLWLNLSWLILLAGAQICYQLENDAITADIITEHGLRKHIPASPLDIAQHLMQQAFNTFEEGNSLNLQEFALNRGLPLNTAQEIAERLVKKKLLVEIFCKDAGTHYNPARLPSHITSEEIAQAMNPSLEKNLAIFPY